MPHVEKPLEAEPNEVGFAWSFQVISAKSQEAAITFIRNNVTLNQGTTASYNGQEDLSHSKI